jgi:hypothetical protein
MSARPYERAALPDDARVTLRHKGVDVPGQGRVTGTTPDGLRCHVRWAGAYTRPFLSST